MQQLSPEAIIESIMTDTNEFFGLSYFSPSNMRDYTLMSYAIHDLTSVYTINEEQAVEVVNALMLSQNKND
jgi:ATP-dependent Clp protease adapter protein ClpS